VSLGGKSLRLPESFVLYHGPTSETALRGLLSAWSWAAGPVGEVFPMVVAGLDDPSRMLLERLAVSYCVSDSVQILPDLPPAGIAALYQRCTVVFHPAQPAPWGDPLLHALACGKPVVSIETGANDLRLGAAAYLAPAHDARALGAALLSVLVEDSVRDMLSAAAVQRALAWEDGAKSLVRMWRETCD
jgi:glycosyltransferase involved in cell wall biosynthesis